MDSNIVKVNAENLTVGMHVSELDRPWLESPFLIQGFLLDNEEDVMRIQHVCSYVYVDRLLSKVTVNNTFTTHADTNKATASSASPSQVNRALDTSGKPRLGDIPLSKTHISKQTEFKSPPVVNTSFEAEIGRAKKAYRHLYDGVSVLFHKISVGEPIDLDSIQQAVTEVVNSTQRNPSAMEWMTQFRDKQEYSVIHALNTCILSIKLGNHIGLDADKLGVLGRCALLHDIGELRLPTDVLHKTGALEKEEIDLIKRHVSIGLAILHDARHVPTEIRHTCLAHHERLDGSGYPHGIKKDRIDLLTRIVTLTDVYDALNSERAHNEGISADAAISELYSNKGTHYDERLVDAFIQCMGIYPVGTLVELQTGEVGLVISTDTRYRLRPTILMILDSSKQAMDKPLVVNTATHQFGDKTGVDIKQALKPATYDIHPTKYFDLYG